MTSVQTRSHNPLPSAAQTLAPDFSASFAMDSPGLKREDGLPFGRHVRSSSDPISRGGNFSLDGAVGAHLLDQEPNPFERSFSGPGPDPRAGNQAEGGAAAPAPARRARSISPNSLLPRPTPGGTQKLPPLSFMQTPSTELQNFGWGADSLRTGPLSPALLNGPTGHHGLFDMSQRRTGLTPMGQPGGSVSFPPPSPATAALFAMMTNNTPGTAEAAALAGGGPRPHEGPNESNHFEASFARTGDAKPNAAGQDLAQQPLNGATRSALANQLNGQASRSIAPQAMLPLGSQPPPQSQTSYFPTQPPASQDIYAQQQQQPGFPGYPPPQPVGSQPPFGNQNPLYLLSQASGHTDDAVVAAAALSGLATPGGSYGPPSSMDQMLAAQQQQQQQQGVVPVLTASASGSGTKSMSPASSSNGPTPVATKSQPKRGAAGKRKKADTAAVEEKKPPAKRGKRGAAAKVEKEEDEDFDDGSRQEASQSPQAHSSNAAETEEEKRKNFLERNRQAALKCRQRKKAWLANLQSKVEMLTTDNDTLQSTVTNLKEEIQSLRAILQAHANCPVAATAPGPRGPAPGGAGYPPNGHQPRY
ncbi:hypothetical protein BCR35DRAFT_326949 [Leucosporidium creatinivorum]|uniref:BZIP domain-containing protein n=1 Tax=Leucosporidium creatinivorum TaxID=106004 RepID=A0A1Y2DB92_9BASI|nr:hypothetical protein BCR35DRAFT_326949 [Leucosporidium creatinivorum]